MMKKTCLLALAVLLLLPGFLSGQTLESLLAQARERYLAGAYPEAVSLLLEAVAQINKKIPLKISHLCLCDQVNGFRDFRAKTGFTLALSEPFLLYFELEGFNTVRDGDKYWVSLAQDALVVDQEGKRLFDQKDWVVLKKDYDSPVIPVYFTNRLAGMVKGRFTVTITVKDEYKKQSVQKKFTFTVK